MNRYCRIIIWLLVLSGGQFLSGDDQILIDNLTRYVPVPEIIAQALTSLINPVHESADFTLSSKEQDWPLYRAYPDLMETLPRVVLCELPTPVTHLEACGEQLGISLCMKRDDLTGTKNHFGGNKPRKLETILADAKRHNVDTVITFGCIGSNHAVATADCAERLGLNCILMLKPQTISRVVRRNLLLMDYFGADIRFSPTHALRDLDVANIFLHQRLDSGAFPYVIPTGAETALGAVGYVNAAFELKEQIDADELSEPDYIYLAAGGYGHPTGLLGATIAGLVVGLKAAGLKTKVVGVFTQPEKKKTIEKLLLQQCTETVALLHDADSAFPALRITPTDFIIIDDCVGERYGVYTSEGVAAMKLVKETEGIHLDGTYTGKAFAALIRDARAGKLKAKNVLFWNTFCGNDFKRVLKRRSYEALPYALHAYFEGATQPLDGDPSL